MPTEPTIIPEARLREFEARKLLWLAERRGIELPLGGGVVRLACGDKDRALFASALILYQTHENLLPDEASREAFRNSTVVLADAAGVPHTVTVTQARQLLVAYGAAYQELWATAKARPLQPEA